MLYEVGKGILKNQRFLKENPGTKSEIPPHELFTRVSTESLKNVATVDCTPEEDSMTRV